MPIRINDTVIYFAEEVGSPIAFGQKHGRIGLNQSERSATCGGTLGPSGIQGNSVRAGFTKRMAGVRQGSGTAVAKLPGIGGSIRGLTGEVNGGKVLSRAAVAELNRGRRGRGRCLFIRRLAAGQAQRYRKGYKRSAFTGAARCGIKKRSKMNRPVPAERRPEMPPPNGGKQG